MEKKRGLPGPIAPGGGLGGRTSPGESRDRRAITLSPEIIGPLRLARKSKDLRRCLPGPEAHVRRFSTTQLPSRSSPRLSVAIVNSFGSFFLRGRGVDSGTEGLSEFLGSREVFAEFDLAGARLGVGRDLGARVYVD